MTIPKNIVTQIKTTQLSQNSGAAADAPLQRHEDRVAELFTRYYAKLVKSLVARTRSWDEARDIASQAFVEILSQRPGAVNFMSAYLYRTAKNIAINRLTHEVMRNEKRSLVGYDPETRVSLEHLRDDEEHAALLRRAVASLAPRIRMAFVLRIWDELTYDEIVDRFADIGVELTVRTAQRYVAAAFEECRHAILGTENSAEQNK
jgi:RNA polymerase sigma factor (sigma-70 family)